jgi:hypothetical protein
VPYIKIEKHAKLTARLENEDAVRSDHFTGEEIDAAVRAKWFPIISIRKSARPA